VLVENVKPRDFEPPQAFEILGRPQIDETGLFKVVKDPGQSDGKPKNPDGGGRRAVISLEIGEQAAKMSKAGKNYREIGAKLGISKDSVGRAIAMYNESRVSKP
jgi:hypothetical protein